MTAAVEACPLLETADEYRLAFGRLAHDKLFEHGARAAKLLAYAIASSRDIDEFFAISRFARRAGVHAAYEGMAPLACYLDGLHFYRVHRRDNVRELDFEALKEAAWCYVDFLEEEI